MRQEFTDTHRRGNIDILGFRFPSNKAVLICEHVFEKEVEPKIVVHDFDGWLQCMCGDCKPNPSTSQIVGLSHIVHRMPSIEELPTLDFGHYAIKSEVGWISYRIEDA